MVEKETKKSEEGGGAGGLSNVLGIFLAGGLGGYFFLRTKGSEVVQSLWHFRMTEMCSAAGKGGSTSQRAGSESRGRLEAAVCVWDGLEW